MNSSVLVREIYLGERVSALSLIEEGLAQRWGVYDSSINPDLQDPDLLLHDGIFLVAIVDDAIIGTGWLKPVDGGTFRVSRMSVAKEYRRRRIGRKILDALIEVARVRNASRVVLETTADWKDAVDFYCASGFQKVFRDNFDQHFELSLHE